MSQESDLEPVGEPAPALDTPDEPWVAEKQAPEGDPAPAGATWQEAPGLIGRGLCMGLADVVPGVSGGTMALILGIYARLIGAIRSLDLDALHLVFSGKFGEARDRVHWRFLGSVVCGQAIGVVICTRGIKVPDLIRTHPEPVYALFFGLVLGSTVWLLRDLARKAEVGAKLALPLLAGLIAGLAVVTAVSAAGPTPNSAWFLFLCGSVSICAMVLPGISGSFVLLLLRQYEHVLGAVGEVIEPTTDAGRLGPLVETLLPFAAGCLVGLLTFVRLLSVLLRGAEHATMAFMGGLLTGSLYALWPFAVRNYETFAGKSKLVSQTPQLPDLSLGSTWLAIGLVLVGVAGVVLLERIAPAESADTL
ncbi:MAG: DUF368 domain-containing protein [Planctomycetes bacterium]|nr:DUF368 domain-containing protein [Planctomycetota bacterium]